MFDVIAENAQHGDLTTLRVAQLIEREYYAFAPPPAYS